MLLQRKGRERPNRRGGLLQKQTKGTKRNSNWCGANPIILLLELGRRHMLWPPVQPDNSTARSSDAKSLMASSAAKLDGAIAMAALY
jgi:hypothetical protein